MKEGKSKCIKCDFWKEDTYTPKGQSVAVTTYAFSVEFEDGTKGLYNAKEKNNPKFKVGEAAEYTAEEKQGAKGAFFVIRVKKDNTFTGGFKQKPPKYRALDMARRMYNSSYSTEQPWSIETLTNTADWILKQINGGKDVESLETAVTIQCANAMQKRPIDAKELFQHVLLFEAWLKSQ